MNNRGLLLALVLAVLAVIDVALGGVAHAAAIPAGLLLVFVLPGYTLTEALQPRLAGRPSPSLEGPTRVAVILGLSVAVTIVLGLLLNGTVGLTRTSWTIGLGAVTIAAALVALARRGEGARIAASRHVSIGALALFLLAGCVAAAAVTTDIIGARHVAEPGFTQLWILPHGTNGVQLGVASHESVAARYSLDLHVRARTVRSWSFVLRPGARWHARMTVKGDRSVPRVALLRCSLHPHTTYRKVYLWPSQS